MTWVSMAHSLCFGSLALAGSMVLALEMSEVMEPLKGVIYGLQLTGKMPIGEIKLTLAENHRNMTFYNSSILTWINSGLSSLAMR